MEPKTLAFIQDNVSEATKEEIEKAYELNKQDILSTLSYLMKIPPKNPKSPQKTAWEERREICDAHDAEMQKVLKAPKSF
jgi:hypothetical protein